jgi:hypothetical protein
MMSRLNSGMVQPLFNISVYSHMQSSNGKIVSLIAHIDREIKYQTDLSENLFIEWKSRCGTRVMG